MTPEDEINLFCGYIGRQIELISQIDNNLFKKILYVSLLDTMGKARFPEGNLYQRVVEFIEECSGWTDAQRVSLVQLFNILKSREPGSHLLEFVKAKIALWNDGVVLRLSEVDPFPDELVSLAVDQESSLLSETKHSKLIFHYRNALIHESREPGYGMELSHLDTSPYYHGMINSENEEGWELVYPTNFLKWLCNSCLLGLKRYLIQSNIDPYSLYEFGSLWVNKRSLDRLR